MGNSRASAALIAGLAAISMPAGAMAACTADVVEIRGSFGQARFTVEVADTPQEQQRGLMFRESLPNAAGMLFVFPEPKRATFWMKNTLIPLDMIFSDESGRVTRVHSNARPRDETGIDGVEGVATVLEINGGLAAKLGIEPGAELRHPALDPAIAAWPCD